MECDAVHSVKNLEVSRFGLKSTFILLQEHCWEVKVYGWQKFAPFERNRLTPYSQSCIFLNDTTFLPRHKCRIPDNRILQAHWISASQILY